MVTLPEFSESIKKNSFPRIQTIVAFDKNFVKFLISPCPLLSPSLFIILAVAIAAQNTVQEWGRRKEKGRGKRAVCHRARRSGARWRWPRLAFKRGETFDGDCGVVGGRALHPFGTAPLTGRQWRRWKGGESEGLASPTATKTRPRQRVQLPTGNGIPLFPGTMIRYVAVWTAHNIAACPRDPGLRVYIYIYIYVYMQGCRVEYEIQKSSKQLRIVSTLRDVIRQVSRLFLFFSYGFCNDTI